MKKEQTREYRKKSEDINYQELPFEFILYVNNNIICQRFFDITNYNEEVLKSYELKELMDEITGPGRAPRPQGRLQGHRTRNRPRGVGRGRPWSGRARPRPGRLPEEG